MPSVLVVGGGIIGASVAFRASQAGASVTLLEAGELGHGASVVGFGMSFANNKIPHDYFRLNVAGMGEHLRLKTEFGMAPWLHLGGSVHLDSNAEYYDYVGDPDILRKKNERLRDRGYMVETLPISELRFIEPDMVAPPEVEEFAYYANEGYVDPVLCIAALIGAARDAGATIRTQCAVTEFIYKGEAVVGVKTNTGEQFYADTVVCCAGHWSGDVAALAGIEFPMASTVGLEFITAPTAVRLRTVVSAYGIEGIRPDGAGRIMMRHRDFDAMIDPESLTDPTPAMAAEMRDRVARILPGIAGAKIEATRVTHRPIPGGDHNSVIGPVQQIEGLYVVATHSGITLGPLLGRLAAHEILTGQADPRLAPFRPERLIRMMTPR